MPHATIRLLANSEKRNLIGRRLATIGAAAAAYDASRNGEFSNNQGKLKGAVPCDGRSFGPSCGGRTPRRWTFNPIA
jgi:hypothetical protein